MDPAAAVLAADGADVVPRDCDGDRCAFVREAFALHNVCHQGIFCLLCSSCVLLYHPSAFCSGCLLLLPNPESPVAAPPVVAPPGPVCACSICGLFVAHHTCVPDPVSYVCPTCAAAAHGVIFSYTGGRSAPIDARVARVFLVASRLSHESIGRAAAASREKAERLFVEAAVARKEAEKSLEYACQLAAAEEEENEAKKEHEPEPPAGAAAATVAAPATKTKTKTKKKKKSPKSGDATRADRDKLLKLKALQQPAVLLATAVTAAASKMPAAPMENNKPAVSEDMQDSGDGSLSYEDGPVLPWKNPSALAK
uniref:Uncharacterized protein n=1 Tax=Leersia perrieri TaxID=77586 RepID=A0A0D9WPC0_9ORYZ